MELELGKMYRVSYVVIKIGDEVLSTTLFNTPTHVTELIRDGEEKNFWVKGIFTEKKNHETLKIPIKFELNIYTMDEPSTRQKNLFGKVKSK